MKDLDYFTEDSPQQSQPFQQSSPIVQKSTLSTFMSNVFMYMFVGLALTGVVAWWFAESGLIFKYLFNPETGAPNGLYWVALLAPLGLVILMGFGFNKLSHQAMIACFMAYALINGITFSTIFIVYDMGAIYKAFGSAALLFGVFAIAGYTTNIDLTKLGNILRVALIALIVSMLVNVFLLKSEGFDLVISAIGVILFTGLTAYDVQKLKNIAQSGADLLNPTMKKMVIYGALSLYLDFINLFLFLLRLFARRD